MSTTENKTPNWEEINSKLSASFPTSDVKFRVMQVTKAGNKAKVVAYIDGRDVMDRLDAVVGAGNWSNDINPVVIGGKEDMIVAKSTITVHGVSKSSIGTASNQDPSKGCDSDAFKRAAVMWGVGRYLYDTDFPYVEIDEWKKITKPALATLYKLLGGQSGKPLETSKSLKFEVEDEAVELESNEPVRTPAPVQRYSGPSPANTSDEEAPEEPWSKAVYQVENLGQAVCPTCAKKMWDNRENKRNPNAPDFVCSDRECKNVKGFPTSIFKPKDGEVPRSAVAPRATASPVDNAKLAALTEYAKAVEEKGLTTGADFKGDEEYAVNFFLNRDVPANFKLADLSTDEIKAVTSGVQAGQCYWGDDVFDNGN